MFLRLELLAPILLVGPLLVTASADPLDCNDMAPVVREMLVHHLQIAQYLGLNTTEAADATFSMNYFHAEQREYQRTFCSAVIRFNLVRFAEAESQSRILDRTRALRELPNIAAIGGLARYANFPDGVKVRYQIELRGNGRTWVVIVPGDPATGHICALPDRHRYLEDGGSCSSLLRQELQWRQSGAVEAGPSDPSR